MDTTLNTAESMGQAKKWLSIGAALAAGPTLLFMFWVLGSHPDQPIYRYLFLLFSLKLTSFLYAGFCLALAVVGAIAGARYLCKKIGDPLMAYSPPVLVVAGFILGALIIAAGVVYIIFQVVAAIASAF